MKFIENFTIQEAGEFFTKRRSRDAEENRLFYEGDHLQERFDYRGYIGKKPPQGDKKYAVTMERIKSEFVSENVVKEIVDRHVSGILGREPDWDLIAPEVEAGSVGDNNGGEEETSEQERFSALREEAIEALVSWWNDRNHLQGIFQECERLCLLEERAIVGAFIPPGFRDENDELTQPKTLREALDMLQFDVLTADVAGIFKEKEKYRDFGLYYTQKSAGEKYAELSWVNDEGLTEFVVLNRNKNNETEYEADARDLNKRLYFYEMRRELLITEQVRSQQKALNLAWARLFKNLTDGKIFGLNADPPDSIADGGSMTFLTGIAKVDPKEQTLDYTNPGIVSVDPVAVETFIKARDKSYSAMLGQTHQRHVLKAEDAEASGKSQIEARAEYEKSLNVSKTAIDPLGRWFLEFSLKLAASLLGREEDFADFQVNFNSFADAGPVDAAIAEQDRKDLTEGFMSLPTYLARRGAVEDPDAEIARLEASELYKLKIFEKRLDIINRASGVMTLREKRKLLFPEKTDEEIDHDLQQMAREDPVIAAAMEM